MKLGNLGHGILVWCSLVVTALLVMRTVRSLIPARETTSLRPGEWSALIQGGTIVGGQAHGLDTLIVLTDFHCPACRRYTETVVTPFMNSHPEDVVLVAFPWPLPVHPNALGAAVAFTCGAEHGVTESAFDLAYRLQPPHDVALADSIATSVCPHQRTSYRHCVQDATMRAHIVRQGQLADALGAAGTPTVVLNGELYHTPPTGPAMERALRSRPS